MVSGTANGPTKDEGPLTTKRMETFDEESAGQKPVDFLERRAKDGTPFFLWHNTTRQHVFIHVKEEDRGVSRAGIEDIDGDGLAEHDAQIGKILDKLDELGLSGNTIVIYTTDNGAYQYMWPEGGTSPVPRRQGHDV